MDFTPSIRTMKDSNDSKSIFNWYTYLVVTILYHFSTPLHYAAGNGFLDIAELLVENGASTDLEDYLGNDPKDWALIHGKVKVAIYLQSIWNIHDENLPGNNKHLILLVR